MAGLTVTDGLIAAGHKRPLMLSTAIAALICANAGVQPASAQSVTISGSGVFESGGVSVVGSRPSPWATTDLDVGDGALLIEDGGAVTSGNTAYIGSAGGTGMVTITGTNGGIASTWTGTGEINVGFDSTGTLIIEAGGHLNSMRVAIATLTNSVGSVLVSGNGSTWTTNPGELISLGYGGQGDLTIEDGGTVNSGDGMLGGSSTATGNATVTGAGSTWNSEDLYVGYIGGLGTLTIEHGGVVNGILADAYIGYSDGAMGTVTVSDTDSAWNVGGAIRVGSNDGATAGTGTLIIDNSGTVRAGSIVVADGIGSTGTLNLLGSAGARGVLETGFLSKGVGTAILNLDGGILRATGNEADFLQGFTTLAVGTNGAWLDTDTYNIGIATDFTGSSSINKQGTGTLTLSGDSSAFTGTTTVAAGTLLVGDAGGNGKLGGSLDVLSGATLGGTGTVGGGLPGDLVTIASGATLGPGIGQGTLTVDGDLAFASGSRFEVEVNPLNRDGDLIAVTGTADLQGGSVAHIAANGQYDLRSRYTILSAGHLQGRFDSVTSNFAFLNPELIYDYAAGTVDLGLLRNDSEFNALALTSNQIVTAETIENIGMGSGDPVYDAIAQMPDDNDLVRRSFDALSGEIHSSVKGALIAGSVQARNGIDDRLRASFETVGAAATPVLAYGPGGPELAAPDAQGLVAWGSAFGSWGHVDGNSNAASIDTSTGGLLAGADTLVGDWRLGLMAGYGQSNFAIPDRTSSGSSDNYTLGLYGGTQWGNLGFRSGAAYSWHDIDTTRTVALLGETLKGNYGAGTLQGFGELSYRFDGDAVAFEPFANLAHVRLSTDGYSETGGAAALHSDKETTEATHTTLGMRASAKFAMGTTLATVHAMAGWRHAYGDTTPATTHAFASSGLFTIAGTPLARDTAIIETGVDLNLTDAASFGLAYAGQIADSMQDHGVKAQLNVKF